MVSHLKPRGSDLLCGLFFVKLHYSVIDLACFGHLCIKRGRIR